MFLIVKTDYNYQVFILGIYRFPYFVIYRASRIARTWCYYWTKIVYPGITQIWRYMVSTILVITLRKVGISRGEKCWSKSYTHGKKLWFNMLWLHAVNHTQAYIITFKIQPCHQKWVSFFFWPQIKLPIHKQIWDRVDKNQAFYFYDYLFYLTVLSDPLETKKNHGLRKFLYPKF